MENKGIWELIAKIASPLTTNQNNNEQTNNANEATSGNIVSSVPTQQGGVDFGESFAKSYNPFSSALKQRKQISGIKAQKPPKTVIELKNSKPINKVGSNDKNYNIIKLINNHNYHVSLSKKPNGKN